MKTIGITGGKGGTGKSTIATALAYHLSKKSRVLLVDADVDCPNDHLLLSIEREKVKDVYQRIPEFDLSKCKKCGICGEACKFNAIASVKGKDPIFIETPWNGCGACAIACPHDAISHSKKKVGEIYKGRKGNLHLVSAQIMPNYAISAFVVNEELDHLESAKEYFDIMIIDTAAGTHCNVLEALNDCDIVIAVTEPTPLGAHDLGLILELLKVLKKGSKVVINRSDIGDKDLINSIAKNYDSGILGEVPYSKGLIKAYSKGEPIDNKEIIKCIYNIENELQMD